MCRSPDSGLPARDAGFGLIADSIATPGLWTASADGSIEYFSQSGIEYTGLGSAARYGGGWLDLLHPEDAERAGGAWLDAVASEAPFAIEYRLRHDDGEFRWHACRALPVRGSDGEFIKWIGTLTDIEHQHRLQENLREAQRQTAESLSLLETLQASAPVGFGFLDRDFRIVRINRALAATTGIAIEEYLGRTLAEVIPGLWEELGPIYEWVLETGEAVVNRETIGELPGDLGQVRTWLTSLYPVRVDAEVIGIGVVVVDISERKAIELELRHLSERDPLTGLCNRRQLLIELERILDYAARYGHAGALLRLGIDNFKWTNNSSGHAAGDQLLSSVAHVLVDRLRETDIVARLGGDEFAIVLPEASEQQAFQVALELRARLYECPSGAPVKVSIGISVFEGREMLGADDVLAAANMAMHQAKQAGGDQTTVYDRSAEGLLSKVRHLQAALVEKRFILHAQPIIDLRSGQVAHRELLIRMLSDEGETIPPGDFLPIAERFSLIAEIDRWVITEALVLACQEPVTVNLSARSIGDPRILTAVRDAITAGLDPSKLTFEITETAVMSNFDTALEFVCALEQLGCELALDDFGTGFGSFTYLKHLPARYLKIDIEFVRDINEDPTDKEIVRSIIGIAHTLGKQTIAEGVESAEVLKTLQRLGVDYAQGYHLGRPQPLA